MDQSTKVSGRITNITDMEFMSSPMGLSMRESGRIMFFMGLDSWWIQLDISGRDSSEREFLRVRGRLSCRNRKGFS